MKICLLNPTNPHKFFAMNKDLAGGMGTVSDFGNSFTSKVLSKTKINSVCLPIISRAPILYLTYLITLEQWKPCL